MPALIFWVAGDTPHNGEMAETERLPLSEFDLQSKTAAATIERVAAIWRGGGTVALALALALCLPNVPQLFGYREYRHAPEKASLLRWRPNAAWALVTAGALALSLFGMWQRLEFLYFQF